MTRSRQELNRAAWLAPNGSIQIGKVIEMRMAQLVFALVLTSNGFVLARDGHDAFVVLRDFYRTELNFDWHILADNEALPISLRALAVVAEIEERRSEIRNLGDLLELRPEESWKERLEVRRVMVGSGPSVTGDELAGSRLAIIPDFGIDFQRVKHVFGLTLFVDREISGTAGFNKVDVKLKTSTLPNDAGVLGIVFPQWEAIVSHFLQLGLISKTEYIELMKTARVR